MITGHFETLGTIFSLSILLPALAVLGGVGRPSMVLIFVGLEDEKQLSFGLRGLQPNYLCGMTVASVKLWLMRDLTYELYSACIILERGCSGGNSWSFGFHRFDSNKKA